jgi:hypothetical protein
MTMRTIGDAVAFAAGEVGGGELPTGWDGVGVVSDGVGVVFAEDEEEHAASVPATSSEIGTTSTRPRILWGRERRTGATVGDAGDLVVRCYGDGVMN